MSSISFSKMYNTFLLKAFNRKNRMILLFILLFGGVLGFMRTYISDNSYNSRVVINCPFVKSEIVIDLLNGVNTLIVEEKQGVLSNKLGLTAAEVEMLQGIKAMHIGENIKGQAVNSKRLALILKTKTSDVVIIDSIFKALIQSIKENQYIKDEVDFERKRLVSYGESITSKIKELESLQAKTLGQQEINEESFSYFNYVVELYNKKNELDGQLQKVQALNIVEGQPYPIKVEQEYLIEILKHVLFFVTIWLLYLFFISVTKVIDQSPISSV